MARKLLLILLFVTLLSACTATPAPTSQPVPVGPAATAPQAQALASATGEARQASATVLPTAAPSATRAPSSTPLPSQTPVPSATAIPGLIGPDSFPAGVNPLTGLKVSRPELLELPPALISVSNFPVTTRPQAGLSRAAFVYEIYTGYGMTRYAAIFYGDLAQADGKQLQVGPIRSGRLPYEPLRALLGGFMLFASGDGSVLKELSNYTSVSGPGNDVNGVFVTGEFIEKSARSYQAVVGSPRLEGLAFNPNPPAGGLGGKLLWIPFTSPNQVFWRYDPASGAYQRTQDNYDGLTFTKMTDRQTGKPLAFENVLVLFASHNALLAEKIAIGLGGMEKQPALLFRDGQMYAITWSSVDKPYADLTGRTRLMRFFDSKGDLIPLKPGHTWVEVVSTGSEYYETLDSQIYTDLLKKAPGSGAWAIRFAAPVPAK